MHHRPATVQLHVHAGQKILDFMADIPLADTNDAFIDDFKVWLLNQGLSARTVNIYVGILRVALLIAVRWKLIDIMPISTIKPLKEGAVRTPTLDHESRSSLIESARQLGHEDMIVFFLATGLRRGELKSLQWNDVLLQEGGVQIRGSKTGKPRFVPVPQVGLDVLKKRARVRRLGVPWVFFNPVTGNQWKDLSHIVKKVLRRAGLESFRLHDLRHAYASHLHENGASQADLMALLGHTCPSTTQRYIHVTQGRLKDLFNKVDEDLRGVEQMSLNSIEA